MSEGSSPRFKITFDAGYATHDEQIRFAQDKKTAPYTINRGLTVRQEKDEIIQGYNELLPTFQGKSLVDWVEAMHKEGLDPVNFTDLGYGTGECLLDIIKRFDFVQAIGFGRSEFTRLSIQESGISPMFQLLSQEKRIKLAEGDLPFNQEHIPPESQNIIVSNNVFQYLSREVQEQVILDSYKSLRPGGIALFNELGITSRSEIEAILQKTGRTVPFEFRYSENPNIQHPLAFKKE